MGNTSSTVVGLVLGAIFFLGQFPGGTIFMSISCGTNKLDGGDWVLSVIIPFYGMARGIFC